jgi:hypothetical protein
VIFKGCKERILPTKSIWILLLAALFFCLPGTSVPAQEEEQEERQQFKVYSLGQQTLALNAGLFIPLFLQAFDGDYAKTNLKLGGSISLQWGIHLDNNWMVGIEAGGMFSKSIQENVLYMLPITVKGSYIFHFFPFEFPLFLGTGLDVVKYQDQVHLNWILKPGFSTVWKYNITWGFGLNVVYWWVLQPWKTDPDKARMGNFLEVTLTAQYNF